MLPRLSEKGVRAAQVVDEANRPRRGPVEGLTRGHIERLRRAGFTRAEVRQVAFGLFGEQPDLPPSIGSGGGVRENRLLVDKLLDDLDSYGEWEGDK